MDRDTECSGATLSRAVRSKPGLLGAVIGRAEAQLIRQAVSYARLEESPDTAKAHLNRIRTQEPECWRVASVLALQSR